MDIFTAIGNNDIASVKKAIEMGVDVNVKNDYGYAPLQIATELDLEEIVRLLIENGAELNEKTNDGMTALMWAISIGYKNIVQLLINSGANLDEKNNLGHTALIMAIIAYNQNMEFIELLLNNGANIDEKDNDGNTALMWASRLGLNKIIKLLINNGAKNIPNCGGYTPFNMAIQQNDKEIVDLFLKKINCDEIL